MSPNKDEVARGLSANLTHARRILTEKLSSVMRLPTRGPRPGTHTTGPTEMLLHGVWIVQKADACV